LDTLIDGSIMPAVANSNLDAPILMIAEKGADDILTYWQTQLLTQRLKTI